MWLEEQWFFRTFAPCKISPQVRRAMNQGASSFKEPQTGRRKAIWGFLQLKRAQLTLDQKGSRKHVIPANNKSYYYYG